MGVLGAAGEEKEHVSLDRKSNWVGQATLSAALLGRPRLSGGTSAFSQSLSLHVHCFSVPRNQIPLIDKRKSLVRRVWGRRRGNSRVCIRPTAPLTAALVMWSWLGPRFPSCQCLPHRTRNQSFILPDHITSHVRSIWSDLTVRRRGLGWHDWQPPFIPAARPWRMSWTTENGANWQSSPGGLRCTGTRVITHGWGYQGWGSMKLHKVQKYQAATGWEESPGSPHHRNIRQSPYSLPESLLSFWSPLEVTLGSVLSEFH